MSKELEAKKYYENYLKNPKGGKTIPMLMTDFNNEMLRKDLIEFVRFECTDEYWKLCKNIELKQVELFLEAYKLNKNK